MIETNKTKGTGTNIFYARIQGELPNKFYKFSNINQWDTKTLEDPLNVGKIIPEKKQDMTACLEVDDDDNYEQTVFELNIIYVGNYCHYEHLSQYIF
jgi:hypothetical protein